MSKGIIKFLRDWALIISMVAGVMAYIIYASIPALGVYSRAVNQTVAFVQPALIFIMLFLTFCKVNFRNMRPQRWFLWLLLIQGGSFTAIALLLIFVPHSGLRVVLEGAMICLLCPTATAAPVIIRKLGGDITQATTYTILINILTAVLVPLLLPYVHPNPDMSTLRASLLILGEVFPILLLPLILAFVVKHTMHRLHKWLVSYPDAPFYIWMVSLALAMAVTARSISHSSVGVASELGLVAVSLLSCVLQFYLGWKIGKRYGQRVTAGQCLGQKNTVFAIWLGYTFFTPITAIAGGFYSIWHNVINSYQLAKAAKESPNVA